MGRRTISHCAWINLNRMPIRNHNTAIAILLTTVCAFGCDDSQKPSAHKLVTDRSIATLDHLVSKVRHNDVSCDDPVVDRLMKGITLLNYGNKAIPDGPYLLSATVNPWVEARMSLMLLWIQSDPDIAGIVFREVWNDRVVRESYSLPNWWSEDLDDDKWPIWTAVLLRVEERTHSDVTMNQESWGEWVDESSSDTRDKGPVLLVGKEGSGPKAVFVSLYDSLGRESNAVRLWCWHDR